MKLTHEDVVALVTSLGELDIKMAELLGMVEGEEQMELVKATWNMVTDVQWLIFDKILSEKKES